MEEEILADFFYTEWRVKSGEWSLDMVASEELGVRNEELKKELRIKHYALRIEQNTSYLLPPTLISSYLLEKPFPRSSSFL